MPKDQPEPVKHLVRGGVVAEKITARDRPTQELRTKIRRMVESAIVRLEQVAQKEFLGLPDIQLLQTLNKLLNELEAPSDPAKKPEDMTEDELAKAAK